MSDNADEGTQQAGLDPLPERARALIAFLLVFLALAHLFFPSLAIDPTFLGLLALAGIVALFDIERIEWLGIKARRIRRELRSAEAALDNAGAPEVSLKPPPPSLNLAATGTVQDPEPSTQATEPYGLDTLPEEPIGAVLWIAEQLRAELILMSGNAGQQIGRHGWQRYSALRVARDLLVRKRITQSHFAAVERVQELRSLAAHGQRVPGELLHEAALLGVKTIGALRALPREYYRVRGSDVPLFKDQALTEPHEATGVVIAHLDNEGSMVTVGAYPQGYPVTTGDFVTWDWDMAVVYEDEAWYQDPVTGVVTQAFSEAASFVGRPYPERWAVVDRFADPAVGLKAD